MTTTLSILLSALAMSAIVALRYVATSGLFAAITARVRPGLYGGMRQQIAAEIRASLLAAIIYGVPAGIVAWGWRERGWTRIYTDVADYPLWWMPLSLILTLFLHDSWFYWTHRWMHRPRPFRIAHAVKRQSRLVLGEALAIGVFGILFVEKAAILEDQLRHVARCR